MPTSRGSNAARSSALVIGAGVAGLWTARALARRGIATTIIDRDRVGSGASHGNAGWISPAQAGPLPEPGLARYGLRAVVQRDAPLYIAPTLLPRMAAWLTRFAAHCNARDHTAGVQALATLGYPSLELVAELETRRPALAVRRGGLMAAAADPEPLRRFLAGFEPLRRLGYNVPRDILDRGAVADLEPRVAELGLAAAHLGDHWLVDPPTLLAALVEDLRDEGVRLRERVEVQELVARGGRVERVRTSDGECAPDTVVVAAGAWTTGLVRRLGVRLPVVGGKGYSVDVRPEAMLGRPVLLVDAHVAFSPVGRRLRIAGTMEFSGTNVRIDAKRVRAIERAARPLLGDWEPLSPPWAGLRPIAPDGLPVLGAAPGFDNLFVATGYSMLGMTVSPRAGELLAEEIVIGQRPPELAPFAPERFARRGLRV